MLKKYILALCVGFTTIMVAGTSNAAPSEKVQKMIGTPEEGKALVVFFRPKKFTGGAIGFIVREGDVELGKLRNGKYFTTQVEPGIHEYTVHSEKKDVTRMEAEAGETYYFVGEMNMGVFAGRPNLAPTTEAEFEAVAKKLKLAKPLK